MKNIAKTLEEQRIQLVPRFNQLEQRRFQLSKEQQQILVEQMRLQGEHRKLLQLMEDFKDESKG